MQSQCVSVVVPARNEAKTIGRVIEHCLRNKTVMEVVVAIDVTTTDETERLAISAGAKVVKSGVTGFGRVLKQGIAAAKSDWIYKIDGDIENVEIDWVDRAFSLVSENVMLVKAYWPQDQRTRRVTFLTAKPAINYFCPELNYVRMPLAGMYLFNKTQIQMERITDGWGFDLDLLFTAHKLHGTIKQYLLPEIVDRKKDTRDVVGMANQIFSLISDRFDMRENKRRIMTVLAHPDDAEIWCGGTIAKCCLNGGAVRSIVVTNDEIRKNEARAAEKLLPNFKQVFLEQAEFDDFVNLAIADRIVSEIREFKPSIIITHQPNDFHIDHRRTSEILLMSLLRLYHKDYPEVVYYCNTYFQFDRNSNSFSPDTFVDISEVSEIKDRLIRCHASQKIDYYLEMIDTTDRMNGIKSGVRKAEGFRTFTGHLSNKAVQTL